MKFKNKGRKIYKTKEKNYYGKSPVGKVLSGALTVLLIGGIGFIGYSVAEPIINYTKHKGDEPTAAETPITEPASTEAAVTTRIVETKAVETTVVVVESDDYSAAMLKETDLTDIDALKSAIDAIPKEDVIGYIELPLKTNGGSVNYASIVNEAQTAIKSTLTLEEIVGEIEKNGFKSAAVISVFRDNSVPVTFPDTGYVLAADGSPWADSQGKLWASPYAQRTIDYNSAIVQELSFTGIDMIICSDMVFPDFTEDDLQQLDPVLGKSDRCMAMTSAANLLFNNAVSGGSDMRIEVSAVDILQGRKDILQPMLLSQNNIIVNIDVSSLVNGVAIGDVLYEFEGSPSQMVEQCLVRINADIADFNVTLKIIGASLPASEVVSIKKIAEDYGCEVYVIS